MSVDVRHHKPAPGPANPVEPAVTARPDLPDHLSLLSRIVSSFKGVVYGQAATIEEPPKSAEAEIQQEPNEAGPQQRLDSSDRTVTTEKSGTAVRHTALLIESDPLHALVLVRKLLSCGFHVETANTARGAIDAFRRSPFGLVMVDCDCPMLDGFEVAAALRKLEGGAQRTPLIALTAETSSSNRARRKATGFDNYLERPVRQNKLNVILERYVPAFVSSTHAHFVDIDREELARMCALRSDGPDFLRRFVTAFLSGAQPLMDKVRFAAEERDGPRLAQYARSLKGLTSEIGALRMQEICGTIQVLASSAAWSGMPERLGELSLAFERASGDLRRTEMDLLQEFSRSAVSGAAPATDELNQPKRASRVLVAESNPLLARFLVTALSANGYEVFEAPGGGREVLGLLREQTIDLVILDSNIPDGNGYFVLGEVRLDAKLRKLPVIILSERHREQEVLKAFEAGADDYIPKPFNPLEVSARVRRLLRRG